MNTFLTSAPTALRGVLCLNPTISIFRFLLVFQGITLMLLIPGTSLNAQISEAEVTARENERARAARLANSYGDNVIAAPLGEVTDNQTTIAGYWVNNRPGTPGLTRLIIDDDMSKVRVYATCGDGGECYWGNFRLRPLARSYYEADFITSTARRLFGIRSLSNGQMVVSLKTAYADNRPVTTERHTLRRGAPDRQNPIALNEIQKYSWNEGFSTVKYFSVGGQRFVFFGNKSGFNGNRHNAIIHPVNTDGRLNGAVYGKRWSEGWTSVEFYTVGGKTYLFLLKKNGTARSGKNAHIHPFNSDGSIGKRIYERKWSENWTSTEFYREGNQLFLIRLKASGSGDSGYNVHVERMNADGSIGRRVKSYKWTEGWTNVRSFRLRGKTYLSFYKARGNGRSGKNYHVHLVNPDGSIGRRVYAAGIGPNWTSLEYFSVGGRMFTLRLMERGRQTDRKNVVLERFY